MIARRFVVVATLLLVVSTPVFAVECVNTFLTRSEAATKQIVTLLTGKLTFQEAQERAKPINQHAARPGEWLDDKGKLASRHFGECKVVRRMTVGCDGKTSGG